MASAKMPGMASSHELSCLAYTDAGIVAVWNPASFATVRDYESWEAELLEDEDIVEHIAHGSLVPICIGSDGAWRVVVRAGTPTHGAELAHREQQQLVVSSQAYLFVSDGRAIVTGYEKIDNDPGDDLPVLHIPPGRYTTTIHLLDWEAEPGASTQDGHAVPAVLPDFVVLLNPEREPTPVYRTKVVSFERPGA